MENILATVEIIKEVKSHPGADILDLCTILGFQCVSQKGLYNTGDVVVFIRPDSILPDSEWAIEYKKYAPKRVKAIRLRKEWSEGIIVDKNVLKDFPIEWNIGNDVTELIGVTKYEAPMPQDNSSVGRLPNFLIKTDEERWENIVDKIPYGEICDVSLKNDGKSVTCFYKLDEDRFGITSRNLELDLEKENHFTICANNLNVKEKLINYCKEHNISLALRGELIGKGIQSMEINEDSKINNTIKFFNVWIIDEMEYATKNHKHYFKNVCEILELPTVEIVELGVPITKELINKYSIELEKLPTTGKMFEGVVLKYNGGSFKVINKYYDSKK